MRNGIGGPNTEHCGSYIIVAHVSHSGYGYLVVAGFLLPSFVDSFGIPSRYIGILIHIALEDDSSEGALLQK